MAQILIVDDSADMRAILSLRLGQAGYDVRGTVDSHEALDEINHDPPDAVLLGLSPPITEGLELIARIRRKHRREFLPVIVLTPKDDRNSVMAALEFGANDYAVKGADLGVLLNRIQVHLKMRKAPGNRVGSFLLEDSIGSGGMGIVYAAKHVETGAKAAVKILPRALALDESYVARFLEEARLASRVTHPNIVRVFEVGQHEESYYLAMEFVDGQDLAQRFGGLPVAPGLALSITAEIALGLQALCAAGVTHRDIKPENIMFASNGAVKITDFGIARDEAASDRLTQPGVAVGSPAYASIEQLKGHADFRSDMYALGGTLFFMLTGHQPFRPGPTLDMLRAKKKGPPDVRRIDSSIPKPVAALVKRLMQNDPDKRFASYEQLLEAIEEARH